MRTLLCIIALFYLAPGVAHETHAVLQVAEFEDRANLEALATEMSAHKLSISHEPMRISLGYHFGSMAAAERACAEIAYHPWIKPLSGGTVSRGFCSVSLNGKPTVSNLELLRRITQPVAQSVGAVPGGWSIMRDVTLEEVREPELPPDEGFRTAAN